MASSSSTAPSAPAHKPLVELPPDTWYSRIVLHRVPRGRRACSVVFYA